MGVLPVLIVAVVVRVIAAYSNEVVYPVLLVVIGVSMTVWDSTMGGSTTA